MKKSLAFRMVGSMLILRENNETPSDADWDDFLHVLAENRPNFEKLKILVVTDGGGPSSAQRQRLAKALDDRPVRVAVVTDSTKVRFIVSSIALLNREIATFSVKESDEAYRHLGLNTADRRVAELAVSEMHRLIESKPPRGRS